MTINPNILTDIDSKFQEGISPSELLKGVNAVKNMILNLIKTTAQNDTSLGERPYENTYGCDLERYLFAPLDEITALNIRDSLYDSITAFLPDLFVTQNSIMVVPDYSQDLYMVYIAYVYQGNPDDLEFNLPRTH